MSYGQTRVAPPPPIALPGVTALDPMLAPIEFYGRSDAGFLHVETTGVMRSPPVVDALTGLLRSRGWGALWTDSFRCRFAIPESTTHTAPPVNAVGQGAETYLERNLREGFWVHPTSFDRAIVEIMRLVPSSAGLDEAPGAMCGSLARAQALYYRSGVLRHRRLEMLFRLLAAWIAPERTRPANECWTTDSEPRRRTIQVMEYGTGPVNDTAIVLSSFGAFVEIVEPDTFTRSTFQDVQDMLSPVVSTFTHRFALPRRPRIDDVAFWVNPFGPDIERSRGETPLFDYLSASVAPGGFLVLQTDPEGGMLFDRLHYDRTQWTRVVAQPLPALEHGENWFLPTAQGSGRLSLQIFWRSPSVEVAHR